MTQHFHSWAYAEQKCICVGTKRHPRMFMIALFVIVPHPDLLWEQNMWVKGEDGELDKSTFRQYGFSWKSLAEKFQRSRKNLMCLLLKAGLERVIFLFSCPRFSDSVDVGNQSDTAKDFSCDSADWERGKLVRM